MSTTRTQVGLHLDSDTIEALRQMNAVTGVPMSEFMRRAIVQALSDYRLTGATPPAPGAKRKIKAG